MATEPPEPGDAPPVQFKKVAFKKKANVKKARKRDDDDDDDDGPAVVRPPSAKQTKRDGAISASTRADDDDDDDDEAAAAGGNATTVYASSRTADARAREGVTWTGDVDGTDTSHDRDTRAILEKNLKLNQEGATSFDTGAYAGEAGRKNWIERKESQIAGNKFTGTLGPIRAPQFVKNTARFDYQPDLCKDYKDTGFCGYGDNCKFLHDRGDYKTGWQLEQEWESTQRRKQERAMLATLGADGELPDDDDDEREANRYKVRGAADDDTLPFACHLCRGPFRDPIVTPCQHYFCANCALSRHRAGESSCAICGKQTSGLFNQATKLNAHARRSGGFQALFEQRFTGDDAAPTAEQQRADDDEAARASAGAARGAAASRGGWAEVPS